MSLVVSLHRVSGQQQKTEHILQNYSGEAQNPSDLTTKVEINLKTAGVQQLLNKLSEQSPFIFITKNLLDILFWKLLPKRLFFFFFAISSNPVFDSFLASFSCVYYINCYLFIC